MDDGSVRVAGEMIAPTRKDYRRLDRPCCASPDQALMARLQGMDLSAPPRLPRGSRISPRCRRARDNQLIGYGLVVGLQGTGDGFAQFSVHPSSRCGAMLQNLGISTEGGASRANNVAAVIVTANLPPFASRGSRIDVSVSSLGDATSFARRHAGDDLDVRRRRPDLCRCARLRGRLRRDRPGRCRNASARCRHGGPPAWRRDHRTRDPCDLQAGRRSRLSVAQSGFLHGRRHRRL